MDATSPEHHQVKDSAAGHSHPDQKYPIAYHFADHNGPKCVWRLERDEHTPPVIIKAGHNPVGEVLAYSFLEKFGFQRIFQKVILFSSDEGRALRQDIGSPLPPRTCIATTFIDGTPLDELHGGTDTEVQQLGELTVADALLNNTDRLPAITNNFGNLANILIDGTRVIPIDSHVTLPHPGSMYHDCLSRLFEDILSHGELCGHTPGMPAKSPRSQHTLGHLSHPMQRVVARLSTIVPLDETTLGNTLRLGARLAMFKFLSWKQADFDELRLTVCARLAGHESTCESVDAYLQHLSACHNQLQQVRDRLQLRGYLQRVSTAEIVSIASPA